MSKDRTGGADPSLASGAPSAEAGGGPRDELFAKPRERVGDFDFGPSTAAVFDDMLDRSVPLYDEIQRMTAELASDFVLPGTRVYDLGCATGSTLLAVSRLVPKSQDVTYVGVDSSRSMLDRTEGKLAEAGFDRPLEVVESDLDQGLEIENASVVLLVLTLQFVRPLRRESLLRTIYEGLRPNGCLLLVEKVLGEHTTFNRLFIHHYYDFKRSQGYSDLEIAQKRDALENVLVPYRLEENKELLRRAGFRPIDVYFKWYNFCGIAAVKPDARAPQQQETGS